jgi:hypothetical protein
MGVSQSSITNDQKKYLENIYHFTPNKAKAEAQKQLFSQIFIQVPKINIKSLEFIYSCFDAETNTYNIKHMLMYLDNKNSYRHIESVLEYDLMRECHLNFYEDLYNLDHKLNFEFVKNISYDYALTKYKFTLHGKLLFNKLWESLWNIIKEDTKYIKQ